MDDDTVVVSEAVSNNPVLWHYLRLDAPGTYYQSLGAGLGWGLGAALGAKLASPSKTVICTVGDGSGCLALPLQRTGLQSSHRSPFLTVVFNNQAYAATTEAILGIAPEGYSRKTGNYPGCDLPKPPLYSKVAEAMGLWARTVEDPARLQSVLREALNEVRRGRSALVDICVSSSRPQERSSLSILPVRREGSLPLSFAQQRLWFLDQLEPGSSAYNMPFAIRLKGELQVAALEQSLEEIVRRHEALRTAFVTENDEPIQIITPMTSFVLPVEDLTAVAEEQREVAARKRAQAEALCPFDLATGPLMRARLVKLNADEHVLLLTLHHIASDGWSMGVLFRELSALYKAFSQGEASPLPPLKLQYADYAVWQRGWLTGEVLDKQLRYWKQQLEGAPQVLELPTDRPRPAVQTFRGRGEV